MRHFILFVIIFCPPQVFGKELSAFEKQLQLDSGVRTHESIEVHDGVKYRRIEIKKDVYYLKFDQRTEQFTELHCGRPEGFTSQPLIEAQVTIVNRTKFFVEALRETCSKNKGQISQGVDPDPKIGVALPNNPTDTIQDKKIYVNPLDAINGKTGAGFSGTF